jgi:hypothetical protein
LVLCWYCVRSSLGRKKSTPQRSSIKTARQPFIKKLIAL